MSEEAASKAVELATELTIAWLGNHNNRIAADDVPAFLSSMYKTVTALEGSTASTDDQAEASETFTPAVTARKSLASKDHIISMIDGRPYKTLRRHLSTHGLTPEDYRSRYNLKSDYPMVASSYSEARRAMAKTIGLGRKPKTTSAEAGESSETPSADAKPARRRTLKAKV